MNDHYNPSVLILLCTYNGERFLKEQLDSYIQQTYQNWNLMIFDDGSKDQTLNIIEEYQSRYPGKISFVSRRKGGFVPNFMNAICSSSLDYDLYSISDQDDIWNPTKIENAVQWFKTQTSSVPTLFCTRTELVDVEAKSTGFSPLFQKTPSFKNAIVQSIAGGNTMVINLSAKKLAALAGETLKIACHDWWLYQLISGCGGKIHYDSTPSLLYRQHGGNMIGGNQGFLARVSRIKGLFEGRFKDWNDLNTTALKQVEHLLLDENKILLNKFCKIRTSFFPMSTILFLMSGIYRQTFLGNIGLIVASIFNKL